MGSAGLNKGGAVPSQSAGAVTGPALSPSFLAYDTVRGWDQGARRRALLRAVLPYRSWGHHDQEAWASAQGRSTSALRAAGQQRVAASGQVGSFPTLSVQSVRDAGFLFCWAVSEGTGPHSTLKVCLVDAALWPHAQHRPSDFTSQCPGWWHLALWAECSDTHARARGLLRLGWPLGA